MLLTIAAEDEETYDANDQEIDADRDEKEAMDGRKPGGAETGLQPREQEGGRRPDRWGLCGDQ